MSYINSVNPDHMLRFASCNPHCLSMISNVGVYIIQLTASPHTVRIVYLERSAPERATFCIVHPSLSVIVLGPN